MILSFLDFYTLSSGAVGTTQVRTGYGFQPKLLLGLNMAGGEHVLGSFGACTAASTARNVAYKQNQDIGTATAAGSDVSTRFLGTYNSAAGITTIDGEWEVSAIGSDGQTTRVTNQDTSGKTIAGKVLALGGAGFLNVAMGSITAPASPGTSVVSGLSFAPDCVLFFSNPGGCGMHIGAACKRGPITNVATATLSESNNPPRTAAHSKLGICAVYLIRSSETVHQRGTLTAWNPDGFTVTWSDNPGGGLTHPINYVAMNFGAGAGARILTGTTATSLSSVNLTTTGGFTPKCGLVVSHCRAESADDTDDGNAIFSHGLFSGTTQAAIGGYCPDNVSGTQVNADISSNDVYIQPAAAPNTAGSMRVDSLSRDTIACSMTDADPSPALVWALAFGTVPAPRGSPLIF